MFHMNAMLSHCKSIAILRTARKFPLHQSNAKRFDTKARVEPKGKWKSIAITSKTIFKRKKKKAKNQKTTQHKKATTTKRICPSEMHTLTKICTARASPLQQEHG